jgi:peroxidase
MASHRSAPSMYTTTKVCLLFSVLLVGMASAQLYSTFYDKACPKALSTVKSAIVSAVSKEARMGASLLRLHFHDCFVQASHLISHSLLNFFPEFLNILPANLCMR